MGSATKQSLRELSRRLASVEGITLDEGREILAVALASAGSPQLRAVLTDAGIDAARKRALVARLFDQRASSRIVDFVGDCAAASWSTDGDLALGLEDLGLQAVALSAPTTPITDELFALGEVVQAEPELELALSSKLREGVAKRDLVRRVFEGRVSDATLTILEHLASAPGGRRIRSLLRQAAETVAASRGAVLARAYVARPLGPAQRESLARGLAARFGRAVSINEVIEPSVLGGVRIETGDTVIDGTVRARLDDLKLQLAA